MEHWVMMFYNWVYYSINVRQGDRLDLRHQPRPSKTYQKQRPQKGCPHSSEQRPVMGSNGQAVDPDWKNWTNFREQDQNSRHQQRLIDLLF